MKMSYDVVVSGGGLVGLTLAAALHDEGFRVAVVERTPFSDQTQAQYDGRHAAISYACFRIWRALGIGEALLGSATPIERIDITQSPTASSASGSSLSNGLTLYREDARLAAADEPLGYMVENRVLRSALQAAVISRAVDLYCPDQIEATQAKRGGVDIRLKSAWHEAQLLISAEGHKGALAQRIGARYWAFDYPNSALVLTVTASRPHEETALEHFTPNGPIALLPIQDQRYCVVWTDRHAAIARRSALSDAALEAELNAQLDGYGVTLCVSGPRFTYPLSFSIAKRLVHGRILLMGDSAHRIHPIAGQGLNLGLKDVALAVSLLTKARTLNLDIGAGPVLGTYATLRYPDVLAMAGFTDLCVKAFKSANPLLGAARHLALKALRRTPPIRTLLTDAAGGGLGVLPPLLKAP